MPSSPHHWFVQTDFGALLGPMPDDALAEMARTGALLIRDRVREGTDGEWRPASEVPGLFDETTPQLGLMSSQLEDLIAPQAALARESAVTKRASRRANSKANDESAAQSAKDLEFEIDTPLITPPPAASPPTTITLPPTTITLPPIVPRREAQPSTPAAPPTVSSSPAPTQIDAPVPLFEPPTSREPEPIHAAPAGWQARPSTNSRWQPTKKRAAHWPTLGKPAWLTGAIAAGTLIALVAAWWFWPRQRPDLYANYVAIYKELQQRREVTQDQAGWSEFSTRAKSQLDATIPWLEERAKPGDRGKSLLLYAGRDLQELLDQPRTSKSPHQKRLAAFFDQLQEFYDSK